MPGEHIDYGIERQRHEGFVGRAALLARLDELLVAGAGDRWVLVTGGPGMGKSALLAAWLARREAAGVVVPHHFIRRGEYDWDDPAKLVGSLVAQLEERFPDQREPDPDARKHPAARLASMLLRVAANELRPHGERLVVLIDGLDEYDPPGALGDPPARTPADPLAAFLPHALPRGVSFLCASRPRHPYVAMIEARDGELERIDLDDPGSAADNDATVRRFWEQHARSLGFDGRFVDEAVACACGNLQHAATLRKHLAGLPAAQRRVERIPRGLAALLAKLWQRIAADPLAVHGLGILCAAREALALDEIGGDAGWLDEAERQAFLRGASELLVERRRADGVIEYRLHHDSIRAYIAATLGPAALRAHHAALAQRLATWPAPMEKVARRYALRHALTHRAEAGDWTGVWRLAADLGFLEAKCRELGTQDVEVDLARTAERCRAHDDEALPRRLVDLARAITRESHWIRAAPEATAAIVWNRLRRSRWSTEDLEQLRIPTGATFLRVRWSAARESPALVRELVGHTDAAWDCAVTPDGERVISACRDGTLKIWNLESGRPLATIEGHGGPVMACAVTPDGRYVVSASEDRSLKVWDLGDGRLLATFEGHTDQVNACAVTPDGRRVVSASEDRTLKIWDLDSGRLRATFEGHTLPVTACVVTPDGRRVLSASRDQTLKIWDLESACLLATFDDHSDWVTACAVTNDGRRVISASGRQDLKVRDLESGLVMATLEGHTEWVTACAVTPDGRRVVSASADQTLKVWDLDSGHLLATFEGHDHRVTACAVTPDGRRLVSTSWDRTVKIWELDSGRILPTFAGHTHGVNECVLTPDSQRMVSASMDRTLKVWDLGSGRVLATFDGHAHFVTTCAVTPDGRRVVSASRDGVFKVWDLDSGHVLVSFDGHIDIVTACAVTPDGRRVISASEDRSLKIWDLDSGCLLTTLEGHASWVSACALTSDGQRMVSASADRTLKVWDLVTGCVLSTLVGHTRGVSACAVTPDDRRVISASADRTLRLWDLDTGCTLNTFVGHDDWIMSCVVTPDGRRAVSTSKDRTLRVWDLDTGACLFTHRSDAPYSAVAASSAGIVAGDAAGTVWFLDWPPPARSELRPIEAPARILFLAAHPSGTSELALTKECAAIEDELGATSARDDLVFRSKWAVTIDGLMRHLAQLRPAILHFSGHGRGNAGAGAAGTHRDVEDASADAGIYLEDEHRRPRHVDAQALAEMIRTAAPSARVVVLNACFSDALADALLGVVDCVIGMRGAVGDDDARAFAAAFYRALGERRSVGNAVAQAIATLAARKLPGAQLPICRTRDDVGADEMVLA